MKTIDGSRSASSRAPTAGRGGWWTTITFVAVAVACWAVAAFAAAAMSVQHHRGGERPVRDWFRLWSTWDGRWYLRIAREGYSYRPGRQSSVAFFPGYPLAMKAVHSVGVPDLGAGVVITLACGLVAVLLFRWWMTSVASPSATSTAVLLMILYPYAFYLFGAVSSDALFLAASIGAFVAFERDRPVLAGLLGAVAASSRPVGIAVVIGLAILGWDRSRPKARAAWAVDAAGAPTTRVSRGREPLFSMLAPVLAAGGLVGYCAYLYARFGNAFAFVSAQQGWQQEPGVRTVLKLALWHDIATYEISWHLARYLAHPLALLIAFALLPAVFRRYGRAYGWYSFLILAIPTLTTKDFFGGGRYAIAAFPVFAVAGEGLASRRWLRRAVLVTSGVLLLVLTSQFARDFYVA